MARRESDQQNELKIHDNLSDSEITLYFRMPTTRERQGYQDMVLQRKRNKVEYNQASARLEYGAKILTGFKKGDFERKVGGGYQAFSCQEGDPDFYPEWKPWLREHAADLVMLLAGHVFDVSAVIADGDGDEAGGDDIEGK